MKELKLGKEMHNKDLMKFINLLSIKSPLILQLREDMVLRLLLKFGSIDFANEFFTNKDYALKQSNCFFTFTFNVNRISFSFPEQ